MAAPVLLDTGFLISLSTPSRRNHQVAVDYFREALRVGVTMLVPTLVVAEFERRQRLSDLGLANFRVLPFNFVDAQVAAVLAESRGAAGPADRVCFATDYKIVAQAKTSGAVAILTEDKNTLAPFVDDMRSRGLVQAFAILLDDGFKPANLITPGAPPLL